jgi:hypothetical protein
LWGWCAYCRFSVMQLGISTARLWIPFQSKQTMPDGVAAARAVTNK